jgi:hypothetical protein
MACRLWPWGIVLVAACGGGGGFPDASPIIDAEVPLGTFTLAWSLTDASAQPLACDKIGAQTVTVLAHNRAYEGGTSEVFSCATGMGQSSGLPPGTYDVQFELGSAGGVLATAPPQNGIELTAGGDTALTPITFSVDPHGALALSLSSGQPGGNCGDAAAMGAGITGTTITLVHPGDGACEPLTLAISAGATGTAGTYTIDCANPVVAPCLEADQMLTASDVPSDGYTIHVRGLVGAAACWTNDDSLQVPPLGQTLTRTLNLAPATGTPGC